MTPKGILIFILVAVVAILTYLLLKSPTVPVLEDDTWWGIGDLKKHDRSVKPFKIFVPDEVLTDLNRRIADSTDRLAPSLEGISHEYGINTDFLRNITRYWKTEYDWNKRVKYLNQYPQYVTQIQGLNIHFVRVIHQTLDDNVRVLPLLLLHGWPGSVREFYEIIPHLTTPGPARDFVFEVIAPSLPGYGFSQAASKPGLGPAQMAIVLKNLMGRLGYEKFYVQGGDWGAIIGDRMASLFPDNVIGLHSNMCVSTALISTVKLFLGSLCPALIVDEKYVDKIYPLSKMYSNILLETGYMHIQATKPDTVGVALNDSPVGLAAYIIEKFISWTNPEWKHQKYPDILKKFDYDSLLDNIMIYWITNSITTSMRLYAEAFNKKESSGMGWPVKVPTACAKFINEISYTPDTVLRDKYHDLVQITSYEDGGHFAAMEMPKVLAKDIWSAVSLIESRYSSSK